MSGRIYAAVAATLFAMVAISQFVRAMSGWPVVIDSVDIPVGASVIACIGAFVMAVLGYLAVFRD